MLLFQDSIEDGTTQTFYSETGCFCFILTKIYNLLHPGKRNVCISDSKQVREDNERKRSKGRESVEGGGTQAAVVWSCLPFIRSGQNHPVRHSERGKKTRQTEEEVGRQHQGMDRPEVRQVLEGSREQGKWGKLVAK